MKKNGIISLVLSIIISISCSCQRSANKSDSKIQHFTIPSGTDVPSFIDTLSYANVSFVNDIIGKRIAAKASEQDSDLEIAVKRKTKEVQQIIFKAFNVEFDIKVTDYDSIKYQVNAIKPILKGGSIFGTLTDLGMKSKQVGIFAWKMGEFIDATSIDIGDIITAEYFLDSLNVKHFEKFSYRADKINIHEFTILSDTELKHNLIVKPHEIKRRFLTGQITEEYSTLDASLNQLGIIPYIRQQANNALDSQIAFSTDARIGDTFEVYIEEIYVDSVQEKRGKMLYVKYSGKNTKTKSAYRFSDKKEASAFTGMYTTKGKRLVTDAV